jgi:hypothetical protein
MVVMIGFFIVRRLRRCLDRRLPTLVISKRSLFLKYLIRIDAIAVGYLVNLNTLAPRNALLLDALIHVGDIVKADQIRTSKYRIGESYRNHNDSVFH